MGVTRCWAGGVTQPAPDSLECSSPAGISARGVGLLCRPSFPLRICLFVISFAFGRRTTGGPATIGLPHPRLPPPPSARASRRPPSPFPFFIRLCSSFHHLVRLLPTFVSAFFTLPQSSQSCYQSFSSRFSVSSLFQYIVFYHLLSFFSLCRLRKFFVIF